MIPQVKSKKILTLNGIAMFHVWALGYATVEEITQRMNISANKAQRLLAPLAKSGILKRRRIEGIWCYSISRDWVENNDDIAAMMEAVDEARQRGMQPRTKQL